MFVTRSLTMRNSPLACSWLKINVFEADRSIPSTWNSNLPSRTEDPAGATTGPAGLDSLAVVVLLGELRVAAVFDSATVAFLSLSVPPLAMAIRTTAAAPTPAIHFQFHCCLPGFAGWRMPGVGAPNGA